VSCSCYACTIDVWSDLASCSVTAVVEVVVFDHGCFPQPQEREVGLPIKGAGRDEAIPFEPSFGFALLLLLPVCVRCPGFLFVKILCQDERFLILQCGIRYPHQSLHGMCFCLTSGPEGVGIFESQFKKVTRLLRTFGNDTKSDKILFLQE
jgi:hypothetical protein